MIDLFILIDNRHGDTTIETEDSLRRLINSIEIDRIRINDWNTGLYGLTKQQLLNNDYNLSKLIEMYIKEDYTVRRVKVNADLV